MIFSIPPFHCEIRNSCCTLLARLLIHFHKRVVHQHLLPANSFLLCLLKGFSSSLFFSSFLSNSLQFSQKFSFIIGVFVVVFFFAFLFFIITGICFRRFTL